MREAAFRPKPRLALVLGSGGVRSVAGAGVADVLENAGCAPDLVVGCSSGALVGSAIAMGLAARETLRAATRMWSPELTEQRRWRAWLQLLAPRWAGFDAGFSMRDDRLIAQRVEGYFGDLRIESLPRQLRIAATEAATGAPVLLTQGRVDRAVRASMALPFIFPSIEVDGRRLVDGVVSDPLPVGAASDARVVVALGVDAPMPRRIDRPSRLVAQASTAMINNLTQARLAAARAAGTRLVMLELRLERRIGLWETAAMPDLYEAGRRAALERLPEIVALLGHAPQRSAA